MALEDDPNWAVERATALPEVWALVAENGDGLVDAWRLMSVCRAARAGAKEWLGTLPELVVCGGTTGIESVRDVWKLDLATLRWEPMPSLVTARLDHACCAVRGALVVLGGETTPGEGEGSPISSEVEMLSSGRLWISCHCHEAGYEVQPQSRWMRATAPPDKCSYSEERIDSPMMHMKALCRQCTLWIWPPVHVRDSLTSSTRALIIRRLGCRMSASSAREVSKLIMFFFRRRMCGGRRSRGGRTQHGLGESSPGWVLRVTVAAGA
jgi:hypothetical protein